MNSAWYTAYNPIDGEIISTFISDEECLVYNTPSGANVAEGEYYALDGYFVAGQFTRYTFHQQQAKSNRPPGRYIWDNAQMVWVDLRTIDEALAITRSRRDRLLGACDWTQLPDVPLTTKEAWATYRQALRDITQQPDPLNIVWPTPPGEV